MNSQATKSESSAGKRLKAAVQADDGDILVMFPDGVVVAARNAADAQRKIARWSRREQRSTGADMVIVETTWDGIQPPTADQAKWSGFSSGERSND